MTKSFDRALGTLEQWARERGISEHGTIEGQAKKTIEEANEILDALHQMNGDEYEQGLLNLEDALGDTGVTWIMACLCAERDPVEMLFKAIEEIRDRRGHMGEDGIFHKEIEETDSPSVLDVVAGWSVRLFNEDDFILVKQVHDKTVRLADGRLASRGSIIDCFPS